MSKTLTNIRNAFNEVAAGCQDADKESKLVFRAYATSLKTCDKKIRFIKRENLKYKLHDLPQLQKPAVLVNLQRKASLALHEHMLFKMKTKSYESQDV